MSNIYTEHEATTSVVLIKWIIEVHHMQLFHFREFEIHFGGDVFQG